MEIFSFSLNFFFFLEYVQLQSYQTMLHHNLHTKLSNEFQFIGTDQNLLHMPHPLFWVDYSLKKHHKILICFKPLNL